jgi:hypothetical protein
MGVQNRLRKIFDNMSLRHLSSRIELNFWQILIGLMSESNLFQKSVRWLYISAGPAVSDTIKRIDSKQLVRWAVIGLGFGLLTGFLMYLY